MPHFFVESKSKKGEKIVIADADNYRHIARSLRAKRGEKLLLIDENQVQYETVIEKIDNNSIEVLIEKSYKSLRDLEFDLYLAQSPLRSEAQSFVIEKATELGVRGIYPIVTDNCALNKSNVVKKIDKWQRVMYEASKQCERALIPKCYDVSTLFDIVNLQKFDKIIAFCERCAEQTLRDFVQKTPIMSGESVLVIIGPEGGFSCKEFEFFDKNSIPKITLGNLILKAETATTVALGNIVYEFENYRKS